MIKKTYGCTRRICAVIEEGVAGYVIFGSLKEAEDHAIDMADKKPDSHFVVLMHICGFHAERKGDPC